ncbi:elongation factor 2-like [Phragmites australis]|uniref:elongation factor 2-like n=1 Tax=Phragmites australis TaxID=29695 RepID=UPI002D788BE3|nr:elongation factor 2-like [Phragmites australis]
MSGSEIIFGPPVVSYRETVIDRSRRTMMSKSPNKHNQLCIEAQPLEKDLTKAIDDELIGRGDCPQHVRGHVQGFQYVGEIRDSVVVGF